MIRRKYLLLIPLLILASGIIFQKQIETHIKIILFITEEFPQIPIKPLRLLTETPFQDRLELETVNGKVIGDLFTPIVPGPNPAVILAMGVKTSEKDKPILLHFADTMARLGYVVMWPRLEALDKGESLPEEPETFIESFKYLEQAKKAERISYIGFSVGSSTAFVASSDPEIADKVHGLVFFGGFYDIYEYLKALDNQTSWQPHQDAVNHAKTLLSAKGVSTDSAQLAKYSPKEYIWDFKAKIFILHDKSDSFVPYTQSIKLFEAMPKKQIAAYHISDLFEHVQPNRPINIGELVKLYGFLYKVFLSL